MSEHDFVDMRSRRILAVWVAFGAIVAGLLACDALIGPATRSSDAYLLRCGAERCDPVYYQCSPAWYPPVHCQSTLASARAATDGGRD